MSALSGALTNESAGIFVGMTVFHKGLTNCNLLTILRNVAEQDLTDDEDLASGDGFSDDGYDGCDHSPPKLLLLPDRTPFSLIAATAADPRRQEDRFDTR
jgi:hypothetical protein